MAGKLFQCLGGVRLQLELVAPEQCQACGRAHATIYLNVPEPSREHFAQILRWQPCGCCVVCKWCQECCTGAAQSCVLVVISSVSSVFCW